MGFKRHLQQEYISIKSVLPYSSTPHIFQLVELSLGWLLPSRAILRFTQLEQSYFLTDTV